MKSDKIIEALDGLTAGELVEVIVAAAQELERRAPGGRPAPSPQHGGGGGP